MQVPEIPIPLPESLPPELLGVALPAVLLLAGLWKQYQRDQTLRITALTSRHWGFVKTLIDAFRKQFYSFSTDVRHLAVDGTVDDVRVALAEAHFVEWDLAYYYEGEELNMRRGLLVRESETPFQQDHVRAFTDGSQTTLNVHRETRPEAHPEAHLDNHNIRHEPAVKAVCEALDKAGVAYRRVG